MHEQLGPDEYTADDIPRATNGRKVWRPQDLPIIPKVWKTAAKEEAKERLQVIADLFKKASSVVNAGDPDREGQLLVDESDRRERMARPGAALLEQRDRRHQRAKSPCQPAAQCTVSTLRPGRARTLPRGLAHWV